MISFLDPRLWLACLLTIAVTGGACYMKGVKDERVAIDRAHANAVDAARATENELQRLNNRWTSDYIGRVLSQQEKSRALPTITLVNDCTVPAAVGRVLNDAQRLPGDAGAGSGAGAAGAEADSTCAAELDIAKRNYAEVCVPNAEQLTELQRRWKQVRLALERERK
jgi:hypothetical protein